MTYLVIANSQVHLETISEEMARARAEELARSGADARIAEVTATCNANSNSPEWVE
jgi:hypothetical protein